MDERDKIIREDYPVEKLPEDLQSGLGGVARVTVTIEPRDDLADRKKRSWQEIKSQIQKLHAMPGFKPVTTQEAVARVRALRDEWDD